MLEKELNKLERDREDQVVIEVPIRATTSNKPRE